MFSNGALDAMPSGYDRRPSLLSLYAMTMEAVLYTWKSVSADIGRGGQSDRRRIGEGHVLFEAHFSTPLTSLESSTDQVRGNMSIELSVNNTDIFTHPRSWIIATASLIALYWYRRLRLHLNLIYVLICWFYYFRKTHFNCFESAGSRRVFLGAMLIRWQAL